MELKNYLDKRNRSEEEYENMIGRHNVEALAIVYKNYKKELADAQTAIMVEACESCTYSSEELSIFKTGLMAASMLMSECFDEIELREQVKEQVTKKSKPTY